MEDQGVYRGQCLCGAVRYEVSKLEPQMGHCHCTMCRKFHGAAFATLAEARMENFTWLVGEGQLASYVANNGTTRRFCRICGSSMTFEAADSKGEIIEFAAATLDTPIVERPDMHIYTRYKADWYTICDTLPHFPQGRK